MIYCATGHRPKYLKGHDAFTIKQLTRFAIDKISNLNPPPTTFWCGGAQGWDTAVALACLELDIQLNLCLPCKDQESIWPPGPQYIYRYVLGRASEVIYAYPKSYPGPWCLIARDRMMVDRSDKVLALWNPQIRGGSGTYKTVMYAAQQGKPVINVWKEYERDKGVEDR